MVQLLLNDVVIAELQETEVQSNLIDEHVISGEIVEKDGKLYLWSGIDGLLPLSNQIGLELGQRVKITLKQ